MKVSDKVKKFQEGGAAPAADPNAGGAPAGGAPQDPSQDPSAGGGAAPEGGQDPIAQLVQMAQQALQSKDCQAALSVCDGLLQVISQAQGQQGGGGAPAQGADQGAPVYRKGGKMVRRTN